jgi:hypothetical protein
MWGASSGGLRIALPHSIREIRQASSPLELLDFQAAEPGLTDLATFLC